MIDSGEVRSVLECKNPPDDYQVLLTDWKVLVYSLGLVCSKWLVVVVVDGGSCGTILSSNS